MKISAKGRYALAAAIFMAQNYETKEPVTLLHISESLGISKIYLEQVFSLLKQRGVVNSTKGAQGGYRLSRPPRETSAYDVLFAADPTLFEKAGGTVVEKAPDIEAAMRESAFDALDAAVKETLENISLYELVYEAEKHKSTQNGMFFI